MMDEGLRHWINENVPPDSMTICRQILSRDEEQGIEDAAYHEHNGYTFAAEQARHRAGYGSPPPPATEYAPNHGGYPPAGN